MKKKLNEWSSEKFYNRCEGISPLLTDTKHSIEVKTTTKKLKLNEWHDRQTDECEVQKKKLSCASLDWIFFFSLRNCECENEMILSKWSPIEIFCFF